MYSLLFVSCFLSLCDYFIDNYISCHVFLISFEVQLLDLATKRRNGIIDVRKTRGRQEKMLALSFKV